MEVYVIKSSSEPPVYILAFYTDPKHTEHSQVLCGDLKKVEANLTSFKIWPVKNEVPEEYKSRGYIPLSKKEFESLKKSLESKLKEAQ